MLVESCEEDVNKRSILFLAANPLDTGRLRLEAEMRDIEEGIHRASQREEIDFRAKLALRIRDLSRSLLDTNPQIVHFSGHGSGADGIVLENNEGDSVLVGTEALGNLFALHQETVQCVVLNACYSSEQAEAISRHIPFVVGMTNAIDDAAALAFAVGFYDAIGAGRAYEEAFLHGQNAIELHGLPGRELPLLLKGKQANLDNSGHSTSDGEATEVPALKQIDPSESRYRTIIGELNAVGLEVTRFVHCIGMNKAVPFDQIYQPTRLLFKSGMDISASAAFSGQNRIARSIAVSRGEEFHSLTVEALLDSPEDVIIFAGPGWGKTTFLHHVFRRTIEDNRTQTVLITLRRDNAVKELDELSKNLACNRDADFEESATPR
jgi:hypothetical protein